MPRATFDAVLANLQTVREFVGQAIQDIQLPAMAAGDIVQAVDEAVTNIILHGYRGGEGIIELEIERQENCLIVSIRDQAPQFDPTAHPQPDLNIDLDQRPPGGLGIYFMRQLTDHIHHRVPAGGGNKLILVKVLPKKENA